MAAVTSMKFCIDVSTCLIFLYTKFELHSLIRNRGKIWQNFVTLECDKTNWNGLICVASGLQFIAA